MRQAISTIVTLTSLVCVAVVAQAATIDTATQGNWVGVYGADGYILPNYLGGQGAVISNAAMNGKATDKAVLPSWVSNYTYGAPGQGFVWDSTTLDVRAPQDPDNPGGNRVANTIFDGDYSITLDIAQATEFELGIYALDWDSTSRNIDITVNGETLDINNAANEYNQGTWGLWTIDAPVGALNIDITQQAGANSTISAITFDAVAAVPEPGSLAIWAIVSLLGISGIYFRKRRKATNL